MNTSLRFRRVKMIQGCTVVRSTRVRLRWIRVDSETEAGMETARENSIGPFAACGFARLISRGREKVYSAGKMQLDGMTVAYWGADATERDARSGTQLKRGTPRKSDMRAQRASAPFTRPLPVKLRSHCLPWLLLVHAAIVQDSWLIFMQFSSEPLMSYSCDYRWDYVRFVIIFFIVSNWPEASGIREPLTITVTRSE